MANFRVSKGKAEESKSIRLESIDQSDGNQYLSTGSVKLDKRELMNQPHCSRSADLDNLQSSNDKNKEVKYDTKNKDTKSEEQYNLTKRPGIQQDSATTTSGARSPHFPSWGAVNSLVALTLSTHSTPDNFQSSSTEHSEKQPPQNSPARANPAASARYAETTEKDKSKLGTPDNFQSYGDHHTLTPFDSVEGTLFSFGETTLNASIPVIGGYPHADQAGGPIFNTTFTPDSPFGLHSQFSR